MRSDLMEKYGNIRFLGFALFVLASIFCLYKIYDLQGKPSDAYKKPTHITTLKLLNVFGRHGDRAPSDGFPYGDKHGAKIDFFWPNGFSNLTDIGKMRQFRIGLELRRRYRDFLSFNSSHYLAFSSAMTRCHESVEHTLRGLFQIQWPIEMGLAFVNQYNAEKSCLKPNSSAAIKACQDRPNKGRNLHLPSGSGSPSEYQAIEIDNSTVPTLDWRFLESNCKAWNDNIPIIIKDLMSSKAIASLKGVSRLADLLKKNYKLDFNMEAANQWSTIQEEIRLSRTANTVPYGEHYYSWITELVPGYKPELGVTYFDLFQQLVVLYYRGRLSGGLLRIELGPLVTSLVQSQKQALLKANETVAPIKYIGGDNLGTAKRYDLASLYADKKAIFYMTHDGTLQQFMNALNITYIDTDDYETRYGRWHRSDDVDRYLGGLEMVKFGASLVFELYETEMREREAGVWRTTKRFAYVQATFYNEGDFIYKPVVYRRLKLGSMCREKFKKIYKNKGNYKHLLNNNFYEDDFPLDVEYSCPFELFKNITSDFMLSQNELNDMCGKK